MLAVVPIKSFAQAKQRMATALSPEERAGLSRSMAQDVLRALSHADSVDSIVVCAGDASTRELTEEFSAGLILEREIAISGLNAVVQHLTRQLQTEHESSMMVVHSDLPALTPQAINRVAVSLQSNDVVIAPDRASQGSNIVAWDLDLPFCPSYGHQSLQGHYQQAQRQQLRLSLVAHPGSALDLDRPADIVSFLEMKENLSHTHTYHYLQHSGIAQRLYELSELPCDSKGVSLYAAR